MSINQYKKPIELKDNLNDIQKIVGEYRGIQGNVNSCYMDSLFMTLFPFTSVFDEILFKNNDENENIKIVQKFLLEKIVKPLRK